MTRAAELSLGVQQPSERGDGRDGRRLGDSYNVARSHAPAMISIPVGRNEGRVAALPVRRWQLSGESLSVFCVAVAAWVGRWVTLLWNCKIRRETQYSAMAMQELGWWEDGYGLFAALLSSQSNNQPRTTGSGALPCA